MATKLTPLDQNTNVGLFLDESGNLVLISPDGSTEAFNMSNTGGFSGVWNSDADTGLISIDWKAQETNEPLIRFKGPSFDYEGGIGCSSAGELQLYFDDDLKFFVSLSTVAVQNATFRITNDNLDMNGNQIIMDADADTLIDATTDDVLDIQAGGATVGQIDSAGFVFTPKTDTGDPTATEGRITVNTFDNVIKIYADGAWRTLASW